MRSWRRVLLPLLVAALVGAASNAVAAHNPSAACSAGAKRAVIGGKVKCLRAGQACAARNQAAYKRYGFTCVSGHLRRRVAPQPPPTTPPPTSTPPAQAGHYKGTTSQLEVIQFDVNASGTAVQNLSTGQINEGCTPPAHLSAGNFTGGTASIAADGTFKIDFDYTGTVSGIPSKGHFTIAGRFSGTSANGTLQKTSTFTFNGVAYSCGSGLQTWTANRS